MNGQKREKLRKNTPKLLTKGTMLDTRIFLLCCTELSYVPGKYIINTHATPFKYSYSVVDGHKKAKYIKWVG